MSNTEDLSKLLPERQKALLVERLRVCFTLSESDITTFSQRLFDHYKALNIFPKTTATLDVSVKALVKWWQTSRDLTARP